jgi:hypothetical protein
LLANAHAKWLAGSQAREDGWQELSNAARAQAEANQGNLVLVVYANPDSGEPGHVAIVRPSEKWPMRLNATVLKSFKQAHTTMPTRRCESDFPTIRTPGPLASAISCINSA